MENKSMKKKLAICLSALLCLGVSTASGCAAPPEDASADAPPEQSCAQPSPAPGHTQGALAIETQRILYPVDEKDYYILISLIEDFSEYGDSAEPAIYLEVYNEYDGTLVKREAFTREEGALAPCMYVARLSGAPLPEIIVLGETNGSGDVILCRIFQMLRGELADITGELSSGVPCEIVEADGDMYVTVDGCEPLMLPGGAYTRGKTTLAYNGISVIGKTGLSSMGDDAETYLLAVSKIYDDERNYIGEIHIELRYDGEWHCSGLGFEG